jgi:hypothetical protein
MEPFQVLNPTVERRFRESTTFDRPATLSVLATIAIPVTYAVVAARVLGRPPADTSAVAASIGGVGALWTLVQLHFAPRRFVRDRVVPMLARALAPLRPLREEVELGLEQCRKLGLRIGKAAKVADLWAALQHDASGAAR